MKSRPDVNRFVIPLGEAADYPREVVGGKAWELGALIREGFDVPGGFVVTTDAQRRFADRDDLPEEVLAVLDTPASRAFRSSAVGEDGSGASFAGQFESVLNVSGAEASAQALRRCWASGNGRAARQYQERLASAAGPMAVIVQEMVPADAAGVAFSVNPLSGADELLIEAVSGLGDALLDGQVTPERWVAVGETMPVRESGPANVLTESQAAELAQVCRRIASMRNTPQDIEWALANGRLRILQSRPITALPVPPSEGFPPRQLWQRDDEHFPEPILPLAATAWLPRHAACLRKAFALSGFPVDTIVSRTYGGRVYSRMKPLGGPDRDDKPPPPRWVFSLLLRLVPAMRRRMKTAARAAQTDLPARMVETFERTGRARLLEEIASHRRVDRASLSDAVLADHLEAVLALSECAGDEHFQLGMLPGMTSLGALGLFVEGILGWPRSRVVDLVQGYSRASAAAGAALEGLASALEDDPEARRRLREDPLSLLDYGGPGGEALRSFLETHGHRCLSAALEKPTWAEDPAPLLRLVGAHLGGTVARVDPRSIAEAAESEALEALRDTPERSEFERLLQRARQMRPYQDETEAYVFAAFGIFRYAALEAGRRLVSREQLRQVDEVFLLTCEELLSVLRGGPFSVDLERRRGERRWALANTPPPRFGPPPQPMPDLPLPSGAAKLLGAALWTLAGMEVDPQSPPKHIDNGDLIGLGCSPGEARGPVKVVTRPEDLHRVERGDVLVCRGTTAAWSFAFPLLAGLIADSGAPLSHPATLAREYGIPCVLSVSGATETLKDGQLVRLDGARGIVWLEDERSA